MAKYISQHPEIYLGRSRNVADADGPAPPLSHFDHPPSGDLCLANHPVARAGQMLGEEPLAPSWI